MKNKICKKNKHCLVISGKIDIWQLRCTMKLVYGVSANIEHLYV